MAARVQGRHARQARWPRSATMQPTSKFGELFQYSNPMAAAAGFLGGHVAFPKLELGAAYDKAMQTLVFDPLGMNGDDVRLRRRRRRATSRPRTRPTSTASRRSRRRATNLSIVPVRPAGGAWSTVNDMLKYVAMELARGQAARRQALHLQGRAARAPRAAGRRRHRRHLRHGPDRRHEVRHVTVVHHGGDMIGFHSDMMWLPEHGVGAVILTNGDPGWLIRTRVPPQAARGAVRRQRPRPTAQIAASAKTFFDELAAERKLLTVPADATEAGKLAPTYANPALGEIVGEAEGRGDDLRLRRVVERGRVAQEPRRHDLVHHDRARLQRARIRRRRASTLTLRDAQHEYVYKATAAVTAVPR